LDEVHSHARSHLVYYPISEEAMKLLREARVLVLIDDEISTGNTLKNLALAFREISTKVKRVILTSLTNWLPEALQDQLRKELPFEVKFASILEGSFSYFPNQGQLEPPEFNSIGSFQALDHILVNNYGRFALRQDEGAGLIKKAERMANELDLAPNKKIRVIGTGEFLHEPFLLANFLEKKGNYVTFQSTTRTPIAQGQAIKNILRFKDNYFENLDNFLYNLDDNFDGETIIVYETATIPEDHDLPARLGARIVYFS
jgi:hypothetical protein